MTAASVSVVIPTIDGPEQTRGAVRSALAQRPPVAEVVVVDDGGPGPLEGAWLGDGDDRVRVIELPVNQGAAAARQAGVEAARGALLAFLDADDRWLPGKLAAQLPLLQAAQGRGSLVAVACGWEGPGPKGAGRRVRIPIPSDSVVDFASGCWYCPGSTLLVPRAAFAAVGPLDARLPRLEDLDWGLRFALAGGRLLVAPVVGARIQPSGRARSAPIARAARRILARSRADPRLSRRARRHLWAYLALERAAAARAEGARLAALAEFARSWLMKPRWSVPLRRWWHQ